MVEAGEAAGILDIVLDRVALQIEKELQLKRRVKGAMIYPTLVMCFAFLVLTGMLLFLVPIFVKLFDQLGGELPFLTKIVMQRVRDHAGLLLHRLPDDLPRHLRCSSAASERSRDDAGGIASRVRIPLGIGKVVLKVGMARFSRTLSSLVGAGVDIIQALEITGSTSGQQPHRGRDQRGPRAGAARLRRSRSRSSRRRSSRRWSAT